LKCNIFFVYYKRCSFLKVEAEKTFVFVDFDSNVKINFRHNLNNFFLLFFDVHFQNLTFKDKFYWSYSAKHVIVFNSSFEEPVISKNS